MPKPVPVRFLDHPLTLFVLLALGGAGTAALAMALTPGFPGVMLDSDTLTGLLLAQDVLEDPAHFLYWRLPQAPFLITDDIAWLGFAAVFERPDLAYFAFVLQQMATLFLLSALALALLAPNAPRATLLLAPLPFLLVFVAMAVGLITALGPYRLFLVSQYHQGAAIWSLAIVMVALRTYRAGARWYWLVPLVVFTALMVVNDTLVLVWIVGPLLLVGFYAGWFPDRSAAADLPARRLAIALGLAAVAGVVGGGFLYKPGAVTFGSSAEILSGLDWPLRFNEAMWAWLGVVYLGLVLLPLLGCLVLAVRALLRRPAGWSNAEWLAVAVVIGAVGSWLALSLAGRLDARFGVVGRYQLQLLVLPVFVCILWLVAAFPKPAALLGRVMPVLLVAVAAGGLAVADRAAVAMNMEPRAERCVAQHLEPHPELAGLASFWDVRPNDIYGSGAVTLIGIDGGGNAHHWSDSAINALRFELAGGGRRSPAPRFVYVSERLEPAALRQRFGEPAQRLACDEAELWLYDNPDLLFGRAFASWYGSKALNRALIGAGRIEIPTAALRVDPSDSASGLDFRGIEDVKKLILGDQNGVSGRVILAR